MTGFTIQLKLPGRWNSTQQDYSFPWKTERRFASEKSAGKIKMKMGIKKPPLKKKR